jgi:protein-tyrosine phosphatase
VLWNPTEDDFLPKSPELLQSGSDFAMNALNEASTKIYVHCAAGVHRAPMMTLAILGVLDWPLEAAMELVETKRPVVDFAEVYVDSVRRFLELRARRETQARIHH